MQAHSADTPHVYTNEDLSAEKILAPEDQERFSGIVAPAPAVAKDLSAADASGVIPAAMISSEMNAATLAAATNAAVLPPMAVPAWPANTPLGDVARYYRRQKQSRMAAQNRAAAKSAEPSAPARPVAPRQVPLRPAPEQPIQKTKRLLATTASTPNQETRTIAVAAGDSLWKIAGRYLGDGNEWRRIASANPQISNPNRIHAGDRIVLPATAAVTAATGTVRVQAGDSLWKLAKATWGTGGAWSCIAESNPQIESGSRIFPGQLLTLPASCPAI